MEEEQKTTENEEKPVSDEEVTLDTALRPTRWEEYIGQEKAKANIKLIIDAAKERGETCDHLLFYLATH